MANKKKIRGGICQDRRLRKAYEEMMKDVCEKGQIKVEDVTESPEISKTHDSTKNANIKRARIKPVEALDQAIRKQKELKKERQAFLAPVSRILPFKTKEQRLDFPKDFRRDEESMFWFPRSFPEAPSRANSLASLLPGEADDIVEVMEGLSVSREATAPRPEVTNNVKSVDDILLVMPLRSSSQTPNERSLDDLSTNASRPGEGLSRLPPIYRREYWRTNIANGEPSRSIPTRNDNKTKIKSVSMIINNRTVWTRGEKETVRPRKTQSMTRIRRLSLTAAKYHQLRMGSLR